MVRYDMISTRENILKNNHTRHLINTHENVETLLALARKKLQLLN